MAQSMRQLLEAADEAGIKLEMVEGTPTWEAFPATRHQHAVDRIRASISRLQQGTSDCGCYTEADVYILFPDGSFKRPDIAVFCQPPPETDEALTIVPEAVVEVISRGYEKKDLETGPPFYISQGVHDVIVMNPYDGTVQHFFRGGKASHQSPVTIALVSGCLVVA